MNPYIRFFFKLTKLFVFLLILDFLIGNILSHYYFKKQRNYNYRTTYAIDSTSASLLIFGSSRANHHYRPDVFEKSLGVTYYNTGRDGEFILYNYAVLKAVLKRYLPKIIILDFSPGEFAKTTDSYDRLSVLLPFYRSHPEMRSIIELRSNFEKVKLISYIYPYNSALLNILSQNAILPAEKKEDIQGYLPLTKIWSDSIQVDNALTKYEVDSITVNSYESFIRDCKNSKVQLYIVCSPFFIRRSHIDYSVQLADQIAKKYNVEFYNYVTDTNFINHATLFDDPAHLNNDGAKIFSITVANRIANEQNKNLIDLK